MARRQAMRLDTGGLVDRSKPVRFRFEGREYIGYAGDSLASALLANGVRTVARSFKYHRPRGVYSCGEEEPCAVIELGRGDARVPNCRATLVPLTEGLEARGQHAWPSIGFDFGRVIDFTHALWPAGFYNKTFKWPSWHAWEGLVRRTSGLGRPLKGPDPDHYERMNWHCDLLVVGGGPAGLLSALIAGRAGLSVLLAEQDERFGGSLLAERYEIGGEPGVEWADSAVRQLQALPNVLLLPRSTVTGVYDHLTTTVVQRGANTGWRECFWTVRPRQIMLATGAIEQGLLFPNNDRPGVMLAGAVRAYLHRYGVFAGKRVVVATNNDSAYQTAFDLMEADAEVVAVIDERERAGDRLVERLGQLGIAHHADTRICDTRGGRRGLARVEVIGQSGRREWLGCDLLAVSGGWAPRGHLFAHAGGRLRFDERAGSFLPEGRIHGIAAIGDATGVVGLKDALTESAQVTADICRMLDGRVESGDVPEIGREPVTAGQVAWHEPIQSKARQWIDLAHDVTVGDAQLAVREGFESVEHFKRYTTAGMSLDQGKTSNTNAFLTLASLIGTPPGEIGTTTFRPPYMPVTLGALAAQDNGEFFAPRRYLPAHTEHQALGALFEDYGWQRPDAYPQPGEDLEAAMLREARAVRASVGVFDNSPIGKLEIRGPDAAAFLDRFYINDVPGLNIGGARYGLMLNENGVIIDDGVFVRLAQDHFLVHTTSAGVHRIHELMEEWLQCEWRDMRVVIHDATTQYANFVVAGPKARETLRQLGCSFDLSGEALPHMASVAGAIAGVAGRVTRVSYSGEQSFEITVPANEACNMLRAILRAGEPFGIQPYGVEALMLLRAEKGFLHVGTETDGTTTPDDVGWGAVALRKNRDFIGRRSLSRTGNTETGRRQLVGLTPCVPSTALRAGAHLLVGENRRPPAPSDGWITSACFSPHLEGHIGLAMLRDGRRRHGEIVTVCDEDQCFSAKVTGPVHFDPDNGRLA